MFPMITNHVLVVTFLDVILLGDLLDVLKHGRLEDMVKQLHDAKLLHLHVKVYCITKIMF